MTHLLSSVASGEILSGPVAFFYIDIFNNGQDVRTVNWNESKFGSMSKIAGIRCGKIFSKFVC